MIGLTLALGAGLPLGKEGPCVHITCCIVHFMFRLPGFGAIRHSKPRRLQMLAVGCAVGVSSTFGAPIGGVLFSIEVGDPGSSCGDYSPRSSCEITSQVTATYFLVGLYWRCFFAAVASALLLRIMFSWWHADSLEVRPREAI